MVAAFELSTTGPERGAANGEAHAHACRLRREERRKQLLLRIRCYAGPAVAHGDANMIRILLLDPHGDGALAGAGCVHRLDCIGDKVDQYLLQLDFHRLQRRGVLPFNQDRRAASLKFVLHQDQRFIDELVQADGFKRAFGLGKQVSRVLDDVAGALAVPDHPFGRAARGRKGPAVRGRASAAAFAH